MTIHFYNSLVSVTSTTVRAKPTICKSIGQSIIANSIRCYTIVTGEIMPSSIDDTRLIISDAQEPEGSLIGFKCEDCNVVVFGPAKFCQSCTSDNLIPITFGSLGSLYSYTEVKVPPHGWPGEVPYILAEVALPEGPHVLAELIDIHHGDIQIGMALKLALVPVEYGTTGSTKIVYKWSPAQPSELRNDS